MGDRLTLSDRWTAARRDASMFVRTYLQGRPPAPLVRRRRRPTPLAVVRGGADQAAPLDGRPLLIDEVVRETPDAVSLWLRSPDGAEVAFVPGQFLTLVVTVDGQTLRRAYSVSSHRAHAPRVRLTIKAVHGGRVSGHLNRAAAAGATVRALGPSGDFTWDGGREELVLIGGGSGITPLMAIALAALRSEVPPRVTLIYGNRGLDDVIFREELAGLAAAHRGRFEVRHVLEAPPVPWDGAEGRLDAAQLEDQLEAIAPTDDALFYVCGPEPMMAAVRAHLDTRGVAVGRRREERFSQPAEREAPPPTGPQPARVTRGGVTEEVVVSAGETLLAAGLRAGARMPFSCTMGGCGACKCRLVEGEVTMEEPNCLSPEERADGFVLACVARPCGPVAVEVDG